MKMGWCKKHDEHFNVDVGCLKCGKNAPENDTQGMYTGEIRWRVEENPYSATARMEQWNGKEWVLLAVSTTESKNAVGNNWAFGDMRKPK